jgi:hypothetical protein
MRGEGELLEPGDDEEFLVGVVASSVVPVTGTFDVGDGFYFTCTRPSGR